MRSWRKVLSIGKWKECLTSSTHWYPCYDSALVPRLEVEDDIEGRARHALDPEVLPLTLSVRTADEDHAGGVARSFRVVCAPEVLVKDDLELLDARVGQGHRKSIDVGISVVLLHRDTALKPRARNVEAF